MDKIGDSEQEKSDLFKLSTISISLDNYNDIFSDFDPRPFNQKSLSVDFLDELKRATRDKASGGFEVSMLIEESKRNIQDEQTIRKRLREHFKKHYLQYKSEVDSVRFKGIIFAFSGIMMIAAASMIATINLNSFWFNLILVLLEPGGWFLGWTGLDQLFYTIRDMKPDLEFYRKMSSCDYKFLGH